MDKFYKYLNLVLIALIIGLSVFAYIRYTRYEVDLTKLRNALALADKTTEIAKGEYARLAAVVEGLKATNADLQKTIDKQKETIITAQQNAVYWKKKYDVYAAGHPDQPWVPGPDTPPQSPIACTPERQPFAAENDFGLVKVTCRALTADPGTQFRIGLGPGGRPLKLALAITRDKTNQFHSYVKVEPPDDENVSVDIVSTAINLEPLEERWYEKLKVHTDLGVGNGVLVGAGASYQFGQFDLGPSVWGVTTGGGSVFYGINFSWAPFKSAK